MTAGINVTSVKYVILTLDAFKASITIYFYKTRIKLK